VREHQAVDEAAESAAWLVLDDQPIENPSPLGSKWRS
jgi:hypothetical protein